MTESAPVTVSWRWVDIGGQQHKLRFDELAELFHRGRLPPYTLVWRTGWLEWLRAETVTELAASVGRKAAAPVHPRTDPGAIAPPSPPVTEYTKFVPKGTLTLERVGSSRPPPRRREQDGARPPPAFSSDPPPVGPPVPVRNVMPTLSEDGMPARTNTLRPTGALPPPPRAVPAPKRPPFSSIPPVGPRPGPPPAPSSRIPPPPARPAPPPPAPSKTIPGGGMPPGPAFPPAPAVRIPEPAPVPRGTSSAPPPPSSRRKARADAQVPPRAQQTEHLPSVIVTPVPPPPEPPVTPSATESTPKPAEAFTPPQPTPKPAEAFAPPVTPKRDDAALAEPRREPQRTAALHDEPVPDSPAPTVRTRRMRRGEGDGSTGGLSRRTITVLTSAGVLIPGIVLIIAALMKPPRHEQTAARATPVESASVAPAPPPPPPGCVVETPARRLADAAYMAVPALVATTPDGSRAAVGFAATKEHAVGLSVDPVTLATTNVFEQTVTGSTTLSVVPLVRGPGIEFAVDRADANLASARTVDAEKRFTLAVTGEAISRIAGTTTDVVWPRSAHGSAMTTPRVTGVPGTGYAVVFREGGQEGTVLVGLVRQDGSKLTELVPVKTSATLVGTPAVAASTDDVLVAFAAKAAATDPWHVELAVDKTPDLPRASHPFTLPEGGPGGEAISPAVEGLGEGRFLIQWTEGAAGNRAVRTLVVTRDLVAVGDPVTLSLADQNAGQGALWVNGNRALALFLVQKEAAHELWAASLRCH